jgi:hypothetical protein
MCGWEGQLRVQMTPLSVEFSARTIHAQNSWGWKGRKKILSTLFGRLQRRKTFNRLHDVIKQCSSEHYAPAGIY